MKKFKRIRIFWTIVKKSQLDKFLLGFIIFFFVGALIIRFVEPGITSYGNAVWYSFVACTSIGFGDIVAASVLGRIITALLTVYEIVLVAMMSGVVVTNYIELIKRRAEESTTVFMDKLEHLTELDKSELYEIQEKIKKLK